MTKEVTQENKLSSDSLFLIEGLLTRECAELDNFRLQVTSFLKDVKTEEKRKIYDSIDKRYSELSKACREIHSCFSGQFERK